MEASGQRGARNRVSPMTRRFQGALSTLTRLLFWFQRIRLLRILTCLLTTCNACLGHSAQAYRRRRNRPGRSKVGYPQMRLFQAANHVLLHLRKGGERSSTRPVDKPVECLRETPRLLLASCGERWGQVRQFGSYSTADLRFCHSHLVCRNMFRVGVEGWYLKIPSVHK